ncbi:UNVERIFIED_CONTAM: hypothetical protein FKN15_077617 [Acipenser sinensis]
MMWTTVPNMATLSVYWHVNVFLVRAVINSIASLIDTQEGGSSWRHGTSMVSSASMSILQSFSHDYIPFSCFENQDLLQALSSLDEDDPNIRLAIQLSLQESGLAMGREAQEFLNNEASLGAIGTSLPSRLDPAPRSMEIPRAALSSSELLELGDSLMRLGAVSNPYTGDRFDNLHRFGEDPGGLFSSSSDTDSTSYDPSVNANLLGNIMAWFHDMNPQSIALIPSMPSETDLDSQPLSTAEEVEPSKTEEAPQNQEEEYVLFEAAAVNEGNRAARVEEGTLQETTGERDPEPGSEDPHCSAELSLTSMSECDPSSNPQPSSSSTTPEWEEQAVSSLDEDDPNIRLAIQLSLQESGLAMGREAQEFLNNEASLGAIGTSLPSRLDPAPRSMEIPRAALSSSELLELGDSLMRLGAVSNPYTGDRFDNLHRFGEDPGGLFSSSSDTDSTSYDPSVNANLLGNIMAWFHDMNPQSIALIPSMPSETDLDSQPLSTAEEVEPSKTEEAPQNQEEEHVLFEAAAVSEGNRAARVEESTLQETTGERDPEPGSEDPHCSAELSLTSMSECDPSSNPQPSSSSTTPEWEEQVHLV